MPPDRKAPTGTSATAWSLIARPSTRRARRAPPRGSSIGSFRPCVDDVAHTTSSAAAAADRRSHPTRGGSVTGLADRIGRHGQDAARLELEDAAVDRQRRRNIGPRGEQMHRAAIDLAVERGMRADRLQFGREDEVAPDPAIIKRLFAEPVADQAERALLAVPQGEGEHADRALERRLQAPALDRGEQASRCPNARFHPPSATSPAASSSARRSR